jgi:hypothetical protein
VPERFKLKQMETEFVAGPVFLSGPARLANMKLGLAAAKAGFQIEAGLA